MLQHVHVCSQQTACAWPGEQEYRTLWQSIFTVFNVAAAGEYDTETYLKVGCCWLTGHDCLVVGAAVSG